MNTINKTTQSQLKVDVLFGDRPQVQESIIRARTERKLSYGDIAKALSADPTIQISDGAIKSWLDQKGIV